MKNHKTAHNKGSLREVRSFSHGSNLEARATVNGNAKKIAGYAIRFGEPADLGQFVEFVAPTALNRTLRENTDIVLLRDHKQELLLARTTAGTLTLTIDSKGLHFDASLQNTSTANDTYTDIQSCLLTGCSFGFSVRDDEWSQDSNGRLVRTLLDIDLVELSATSFPAYQSTNVDVRSIRNKINQGDSSDDDTDCDPDVDDDCEDDDDEERDCDCDCSECQDGHCSECQDGHCDDDDCEACPMQDEARSNGLRVRTLFALRSQ